MEVLLYGHWCVLYRSFQIVARNAERLAKSWNSFISELLLKFLVLLRPFSTASSIAFMLSEVFVNEMFLCSSNTLYNSSVNEREIKQTPSKSRTILSLMPSIAERIMFAFARERISVLINSEIFTL